MTKKIFSAPALIIFLIFVSLDTFSFSVVKTVPIQNSTEAITPDYLRASVFVKMSPGEFAAVTGKKLNFFQRMYFKVIKRQVKRELKKNPDLLITDYFDQKEGKFKFDLLWFVITAFIGPLGLLVAYTSKQRKGGPNRKDKITSAWLGFAFFVLWFGLIFVF